MTKSGRNFVKKCQIYILIYFKIFKIFIKNCKILGKFLIIKFQIRSFFLYNGHLFLNLQIFILFYLKTPKKLNVQHKK